MKPLHFSILALLLSLSGSAFAHSGHHDDGLLMSITHILTNPDHLFYLVALAVAGAVFAVRRPLLRVLRISKPARSTEENAYANRH